MTKIQVCFLVVIILTLVDSVSSQSKSNHSKPTTSLGLMSFNIRNGMAKDGENKWENRKSFVCDVIKESDPDVVGLQEAFHFQLEYLKEKLPHYSAVGEGRDGGEKGEYSAILYRRKRFNIKDSGTFWLSDTPDKKSRSWGNRYFRICTWARLSDSKTGQTFYIYNTHFDHQSQNARYRSAKLVASRISKRVYPVPFVFMGDLNAGEENDVVLYLKGKQVSAETAKSPIQMADSFRVLHPKVKDVGTGGGFAGRRDGPKIDYIFVSKGVTTTTASIIRTSRDKKFPSDHFPVYAKIMYPNSD